MLVQVKYGHIVPHHQSLQPYILGNYFQMRTN